MTSTPSLGLQVWSLAIYARNILGAVYIGRCMMLWRTLNIISRSIPINMKANKEKLAVIYKVLGYGCPVSMHVFCSQGPWAWFESGIFAINAPSVLLSAQGESKPSGVLKTSQGLAGSKVPPVKACTPSLTIALQYLWRAGPNRFAFLLSKTRHFGLLLHCLRFFIAPVSRTAFALLNIFGLCTLFTLTALSIHFFKLSIFLPASLAKSLLRYCALFSQQWVFSSQPLHVFCRFWFLINSFRVIILPSWHT